MAEQAPSTTPMRDEGDLHANPSVKKVAVTAIIGAAATVLQEAYKVPEDESRLLMEALRALINRMFGHH